MLHGPCGSLTPCARICAHSVEYCYIQPMPRIVLVDDHAIVREGFKRLIQLEPDLDVVAEARNADEAVDAVTQHRPDLVAVDLSLPDGSGLPLIEHLGSIEPNMRIVVLSK